MLHARMHLINHLKFEFRKSTNISFCYDAAQLEFWRSHRPKGQNQISFSVLWASKSNSPPPNSTYLSSQPHCYNPLPLCFIIDLLRRVPLIGG